jgi:septum formation protein
VADFVVLASRSPRRRSLLEQLGVPIRVDAPEVDESPEPGEAPDRLVCRLSCKKATEVARRRPGSTVLAADTVVVLEGRILGKPRDAEEAKAMLRALRGRTHQVLTAVTVAQGGESETRLVASDVLLRDYSEGELAEYVDSGDPLDKAGAYAIQHAQFRPVARWEGCFTSIMGLPLRESATLLRRAGFDVPDRVNVVCRNAGAGSCCAAGSLAPNRKSPACRCEPVASRDAR